MCRALRQEDRSTRRVAGGERRTCFRRRRNRQEHRRRTAGKGIGAPWCGRQACEIYRLPLLRQKRQRAHWPAVNAPPGIEGQVRREMDETGQERYSSGKRIVEEHEAVQKTEQHLRSRWRAGTAALAGSARWQWRLPPKRRSHNPRDRPGANGAGYAIQRSTSSCGLVLPAMRHPFSEAHLQCLHIRPERFCGRGRHGLSPSPRFRRYVS